MKSILVKLVIMGTVATAFSGKVLANEKKTERKFFKCVRETVDTKRLDDAHITSLHSVLKKYKKESTEDLLEACQTILEETQSLPERDNSDMYQTMWKLSMESAVNSKAASKVLTSMLSPIIKCNMGAIEANVSVYVGVGLGVGIGFCRSENGQRYGVFLPSAAYNAGWGASAIMKFGEFKIKKNEVATVNGNIITGLVFAYEDSIPSGYGVGIAAIITTNYTLHLKVLPGKNNFDDLKALF